MGYRIHVATKYEVRYSVGDAFNYKCEEFHNLLSLCGADYTGETYDPEFEVSKSDWKNVMEKLKNLELGISTTRRKGRNHGGNRSFGIYC